MAFELQIRREHADATGSSSRASPAGLEAFESEFRDVVLGIEGADSATTVDAGRDGSLVVSTSLDSIQSIGPAAVELAERYGLAVFDPQHGEWLAPAAAPIDWSAVSARARRRHQAYGSALRESVRAANDANSRDQIIADFVSRIDVPGPAVTRHTVNPRPLGDLKFPVPELAPLPDLERTLRDLRHPRREHRGMAAFRLGGHPASTRTVRALHEVLERDPDAYVRATAGKSLALLGDTSAFDALRSLVLEMLELAAASDLVEAVSSAAHGLVLLALLDDDRVQAAAQVLSAIERRGPAELRSRTFELEAMLRRTAP